MAYLSKSLTCGRYNLVKTNKFINFNASQSVIRSNDGISGFVIPTTNPSSFRSFSSSPVTRHSIDVSTLKGKHLDNLFLLSSEEITQLLRISHGLKKKLTRDPSSYQPLIGRSMAMIFQKRSTRTRVSTETGFAQLGGHALFLGSEDIQLGKNESLYDTAKVLSRYNDIILARVYGHSTITELCTHSTVPVINALSDTHHPLQGLADLMTLQQYFKRLEGLTIAWVGDGNNILHTLLSAAGKMGYNVRYATPKGYEPSSSVVELATKEAKANGVNIVATNDPLEAVKGADAIVTDTWVSMGQEDEYKKRLNDFTGYQVTTEMVTKGGAKKDWVFLHCLPRKPQEVNDEVFYSPRSLVWDEAENRKWTVMAVALAQILGGADI